MADSGRLRGWKYDHANANLEVWVDGTNVGTWDDATNDLVLPTNGLTITAGGATVTAGDLTVTAGDAHVVAENLYMGAETAFATTEPTSTVIFKQGTAPAGAIGTSSALFSNGTLMRKIIADGTISNIQA
jgi:hypothetical protein